MISRTMRMTSSSMPRSSTYKHLHSVKNMFVQLTAIQYASDIHKASKRSSHTCGGKHQQQRLISVEKTSKAIGGVCDWRCLARVRAPSRSLTLRWRQAVRCDVLAPLGGCASSATEQTDCKPKNQLTYQIHELDTKAAAVSIISKQFSDAKHFTYVTTWLFVVPRMDVDSWSTPTYSPAQPNSWCADTCPKTMQPQMIISWAFHSEMNAAAVESLVKCSNVG